MGGLCGQYALRIYPRVRLFTTSPCKSFDLRGDVCLEGKHNRVPEWYSGTLLLCPFSRMVFGHLPPMSILPNVIRIPSFYVHSPECYSGTFLLCPFSRMLFGHLLPMSITPNVIRIPSSYVHYPE